MWRRTCFQGHPPVTSWRLPGSFWQNRFCPESFLWPCWWADPEGLNCSAIFRIVFSLTRSSSHAHWAILTPSRTRQCSRKYVTVCYRSHSINAAFCAWLTDWPVTRKRPGSHRFSLEQSLQSQNMALKECEVFSIASHF